MVPQAARQWRWQQRAAAFDSPASGCLPLQAEWCNQLLREAAYKAEFTGLEDTNRALARAAIGQMDRAASRRLLNPLVQYQRGLFRLIPPSNKEQVHLDFDDEELQGAIRARVSELRMEIMDPIISAAYAGAADDAATDPESGGAPHPTVDSEESQSDSRASTADEDPGETKPWYRQPGELANHFHWFQIFLSLMFFQSTAQVANMAKTGRNATLAKIARKWRWQERALAFDAHDADQPLARSELQGRLLRQKAFDAQLHGLLQSSKALDSAKIGQLDRVKARKDFSVLSRRQLSILQHVLRHFDAASGQSPEERRELALADYVNEQALPIAMEEEERDDEMLIRLYGDPADDE